MVALNPPPPFKSLEAFIPTNTAKNECKMYFYKRRAKEVIRSKRVYILLILASKTDMGEVSR